MLNGNGSLRIAVAALVFAGASHALAQSVQGSFERTLNVSGKPDVEISTGSGDVRVELGNGGQVRVIGKIRAGNGWFGGGGGLSAEQKVQALEKNPPIVQTGNFVRIGKIEDHSLRQNISISYTVYVPAETTVKSETGSGNQNVEGVSGPVKVSTGSGDVEVSRIGSELSATSGSGNMMISEIKGRLTASTGSGDVRATGIGGAASVSTGSGNIRVGQSAPGDIRVETGSGDVEIANVEGGVRVSTGSGNITVNGKPTGEWRAKAGSGDITLQVPQGQAFTLDASSSSGSIDTNLPITVQGRISRRELRGTVNGGGVLVAAETGSGSINIR